MKCPLGVLTIALVSSAAGLSLAERGFADPLFQQGDQTPKTGKSNVGLVLNDPKAFQGYTLVSPLMGNTSYLIDMRGRVVRRWQGASWPGMYATLLPNGNLFRPYGRGTGGTGAAGIQEFTWDGELVWDYKFPGKYEPHHDVIKLPNGNALAVVLEKKTARETAAAGRKAGDAVEADCLLEIRPAGKDGGEIVWQWSVWDHLIQDHDEAKAKFDKVGEHPELIDFNFGGSVAGLAGQGKNAGAAKGFGGPAPGGAWTHINGVAYNADLDQLMLSVHGFSEFWIIDHGTSTADAAGHKGGKQGRGGDLLYRWGNPQAYRAGDASNRRLFMQHNAHWIPKGRAGAGHVLLFNNGVGRPDGVYSTVDEVELPVDAKSAYVRPAGAAFGPDKALWSYSAPNKTDFYSMIISGAQRLPNGNTLICSGTEGVIFETTPQNEIVWKFVNPGTNTLAGLLGLDLGKTGGGLMGFFTGQMIFRAYRYGPEEPALARRELVPGLTMEEDLRKVK